MFGDKRIADRSRGGFTLIEVLVVLALLAAIVAIVAPTLFSQLEKGDVARVTGDAGTVSSAVKTFRVDVSPLVPGDLEDLVHPIDGSDLDIEGNAYSQGAQNRWNGSYLESTIAEGGAAASSTVGFETGFGGLVRSDLSLWNAASTTSANVGAVPPGPASGDWIAMAVAGLARSQFESVDAQVEDDDSGAGAGDDDNGRVRWDDTNGVLYYLVAQN